MSQAQRYSLDQIGQIRERRVSVGKIALNVAELGVGPPVVLLHGFPEFWFSWRAQMVALANAGYRAIAPDLRGYNRSDKPTAIRDYTMTELTGDVLGLLDALGLASVDLVTHDWGGAVGWHVAAHHGNRLRSFTVCNSPHPKIFRKLLATPRQLLRSWYMFVFQLPGLPERFLQQPNFARDTFVSWAVHPERFPAADLAKYTEAYAQPGAPRGMLNYYRAGLRHPEPLRENVRVPTLVIWGEQDRALGIECLDGLERYVDDLTIVKIPDASHWVQQDTPDEVNRALLGFLAKQPSHDDEDTRASSGA